jgi:protein dithiol oxidoreductase (disulfide-forming)
MKKWLLIAVMLVSAVARAGLVEGEGKDFTRLAVPQPVANPKKIEVIEFFSYSCIHCYHLDQGLMAWAKKKPADVDFKRVQIVWGAPMEGLARFFSTMNELNLADKLNHPAFAAVMDKHINIGDPTELAAWLKTQPGIDVKRFMQTFNSFGTNARVATAKQMTRDYAIQGTPTIVVNGKYALQPATPAVLLQHLDQMVAVARKDGRKP